MADDESPVIQLDDADFADESTDVNEAPVEQQDATAEDSSSEGDQETEAAADETEDTEGDTEAEEATDAEDTADEQPLSAADERKQQLNTEIRDLVTQRNSLRQEVERINGQVYGARTPEQIMEEDGLDDVRAEMKSMREERELQAYNERVSEAQLVIGTESQRVIQDFPMFNPDSPEYKPAVAEQAAQLLRQSLEIDPNTNQVVGSTVSPYQLYQTIASANQVSAVENQIAGQKATEQMLASAEPQGSVAPKQPKEDPFLAGLLGKT